MKTSLKPAIAFYYAIYVVTLIIAAIGSFYASATPWVAADPAVVKTIYSLLILYLLISIPFSLKWLSTSSKKVRKLTDANEKIKRYRRNICIVLSITAFGLIASLLCFYLFKETSFIYMAGIEIIALLFCKPTEKKMLADLFTDEIDETTDQNTTPETDEPIEKNTKNE